MSVLDEINQIKSKYKAVPTAHVY